MEKWEKSHYALCGISCRCRKFGNMPERYVLCINLPPHHLSSQPTEKRKSKNRTKKWQKAQ